MKQDLFTLILVCAGINIVILWGVLILKITSPLEEDNLEGQYQKGILEGKRQLSLEINKDLPMLASCLLEEIKENPPR